MKFSVGYQLCESDSFMEELILKKSKIGEIYFSYGDMPNGRHSADIHGSLPSWEAKCRTDEDLYELKKHGFSFNLLLNGNCYGGKSLSKAFLTSVCERVDEVGERFGLKSVTTTSPVIARLIKANFKDLEVRASVNMELRTVDGMEYLTDCFDSFYIARELNRDISVLKSLREWCIKNGKKSYILANSGCLNNCSARQFHDNLVAHEKEIMAMDNAVNFNGICKDYLKNSGDTSLYLKRLNFIRPEDIPLFEGLADGVKLATRVNRNPAQVLRAYTDGHYAGNLLELLEPDHAALLHPFVIENSLLPEDFSRSVYYCGGRCRQTGCNKCANFVGKSLIKLPDTYIQNCNEQIKEV